MKKHLFRWLFKPGTNPHNPPKRNYRASSFEEFMRLRGYPHAEEHIYNINAMVLKLDNLGNIVDSRGYKL